MILSVSHKCYKLVVSIFLFSSFNSLLKAKEYNSNKDYDVDKLENENFRKNIFQNKLDAVEEQGKRRSHITHEEKLVEKDKSANTPVILINNIPPQQPIYIPQHSYGYSPEHRNNQGYNTNNDGMIATTGEMQQKASKTKKVKEKEKKKKNKKEDTIQYEVYDGGYDYNDINDNVIFSKHYDYNSMGFYKKKYKSFTFNIGTTSAMLALLVKNMYDKYENPTNTERKTIFSFFRDKLFSRDGIGIWTLFARIVTNFCIEKRHVVCSHLAIGYSFNHLMFPGFILDINTGYKNSTVFSCTFRFGIDEPIKLSLNLKLGGFLIKIDTVRISTVDILYAFYNNGLKKSTNNATTSFWSNIFKKADEMVLNKYYYWEINNPLAEKVNMKDSSIFSMLIGGLSIGLGGMWSVD